MANSTGVDFAAALAALKNTQTAAKPAATASDKPKAALWLNIGYHVPVEVTAADGTTSMENRFVSLPVGIPVDTMQLLPENSQNLVYAAFQSARNELLKLIIAAGANLGDGEERPIALEIQLRRVSAPQAPIAPDTNPFIKQIKL